jgi:cell division protein FtsI (penicillin-binding protein 3)
VRDLKAVTAAERPNKWMRLRVLLLGALFGLLLVGMLAKAVHLQVVQRDWLRELAQDQYMRQIETPARRGDIFDRRGTPLAQSVEVDSIWIDPSMSKDLKATARALAKPLGLDKDELTARLVKAKRFAWVKRQARTDEVAAVTALDIEGLGFTREPRRYYPQRELAAHLIGLVGNDSAGLDGLEFAFDDMLTGQASQMSGFRDAKGRKLLTRGVDTALDRQGASVTLTIDRQLQYLAEKALGHSVEDAKATAGMAVVLDPKTGQLLALANYPRFNPNAPSGSAAGALRNRAALDAFEPGSTMKAFVVAGALEDKTIKEADTFFCENGSWTIGRHTIHDSHTHGWLDAAKILQVSSNIGAAKVAQAMGREKLVDTYARFGFGERSGLSLPGEPKGSVPYPKAEVAFATEAFGQGLTVTAVQLAAAYGALANGGVLMHPYVVSKVVDADGLVLVENTPKEVRRVVSEKTARAVVTMLEGVVEKEGTAPRARMDEYRVAGKTGTAQKVDPVARGYSEKRIASFIGMVPAEDPRAVILIVIDEPKTDVYGGLVAAPAFKEIAAAAMPYLGVPPSRPGAVVAVAPAPVPDDARIDRPEAARSAMVAPSKGPLAAAFARLEAQETVTEAEGEGSVAVPDVSGQVGRAAVARLLGVALEPRLTGSGRVVSQTPPAGTLVEKGTWVTLQLASRQ